MTTPPDVDLPLTEREVTFLIADLAGFTALTEIHGSRHAAWVVTRYVAIVRAALHPAARLAERVGDAVLIVAPEAASAVRTAVDLRAATERESLFPLLRLGIHGGPVVELNGSYFGTPLNLTARLAAHAAPGQILCTEAVASAASGLEGVEFRDLGPVTLKNIVAPVSIFEVVATSRHLEGDLVDPVCQMRVDPLTAASQLAHGGRTYLFCSPECARAFAAAGRGIRRLDVDVATRPPQVPENGPPAAPALRRTLSLWQVSVSGIGVILGAGVYALVGPAAGLAGNALWLAFLLAGVAAGLTAYSYARLGTMRPKDSPEFQYTALAFGPRIGFLAGWLMLAADLLAVAAVALGFGGYLAHLAGTPAVANALALLAVTVIVLLAGIGESVRLAILLTVVEAAGLLFVIAIGLPDWGRVSYLDAPHGFAGLSGAAALIFFAYLGFDEIGNFAEEMHQPQRNLPRALFISMAGATLIYLLVALSVTAAVGWQDLSASTAPLALVARQVLGPTADTAISVVALAATANTVLLLLVAGARSVYGMAEGGVLPPRLGAVGGRGIPVRATLLVTGITGSLVLLGDLAQVAALTDAAVLLSFMLVNLSLPWLARRGATGPGLARRTLDLVLPSLALLMCGWLLLHTGWSSLAAAAGLAVLGLAMGRRRPERGTDASPPAPASEGARAP